jgi:hypothetical protein
MKEKSENPEQELERKAELVAFLKERWGNRPEFKSPEFLWEGLELSDLEAGCDIANGVSAAERFEQLKQTIAPDYKRPVDSFSRKMFFNAVRNEYTGWMPKLKPKS